MKCNCDPYNLSASCALCAIVPPSLVDTRRFRNGEVFKASYMMDKKHPVGLAVDTQKRHERALAQAIVERMIAAGIITFTHDISHSTHPMRPYDVELRTHAVVKFP